MSRIHILHVIYQLSMGGLENGLINLINALPEDNFEHTILSLTKPDDMQKRLNRQNVTVLTLDKKPGPLMTYFFECYQLFKKINPDILHTRNLATLECQVMGWASRVPYRIHSEHGRDAHDFDAKVTKNIVLRKFIKPFIHQYIALSDDLKRYLIDRININPNRIRQIYNGVDTQKFCPIKTPDDKIVILSAGRLDAVKDFTTLIKAFAPVARTFENVELQIAGVGSELDHLKQLVLSLDIHDKVHFLGLVNDMSSLMGRADLYVQTSLFEGISNTILEAMSAGCAIVTTHVGGNPELIENFSSGELIEAKDNNALSRTMQKLIVDQTLRQKYQHNARHRACAHFSLSKMVDSYEQLYQGKRSELCVA